MDINIVPFSGSYYLIHDIEISCDETRDARISEKLYAYIQDVLYGAVSTPIVLKTVHDGTEYVVSPSSAVSGTKLSVPKDTCSSSYREFDSVLCLKPETSKIMYDGSR